MGTAISTWEFSAENEEEYDRAVAQLDANQANPDFDPPITDRVDDRATLTISFKQTAPVVFNE